MSEPVPFEVYEEGVYLHGTRAVLAPGELLTLAQPSNYRVDAPLRHVCVTEAMHAAAWGAQLPLGEVVPQVYVVEPTGEIEDDPSVTDKRFPGNPIRSYRTLEPVRVLRELKDWARHSKESVLVMREGLARLWWEGPTGSSADRPVAPATGCRAARGRAPRTRSPPGVEGTESSGPRGGRLRHLAGRRGHLGPGPAGHREREQPAHESRCSAGGVANSVAATGVPPTGTLPLNGGGSHRPVLPEPPASSGGSLARTGAEVAVIAALAALLLLGSAAAVRFRRRSTSDHQE